MTFSVRIGFVTSFAKIVEWASYTVQPLPSVKRKECHEVRWSRLTFPYIYTDYRRSVRHILGTLTFREQTLGVEGVEGAAFPSCPSAEGGQSDFRRDDVCDVLPRWHGQ
jgi:hypothetical protein